MLGTELTGVPPTIINNHMAALIQAYFADADRHQDAVEFFSSLLDSDTEMPVLIGEHLLQLDREIEAVKLWNKAQIAEPLKSSSLMLVQAEYLWQRKQRMDLAHELLTCAVQTTPADTRLWIALASLYAEQGKHAMALTTLNSCPAMSLQFERNGGALESQIDFGRIATEGTGGVWTSLYQLTAALPPPTARLMPIFEEAVVPQDLIDDIGPVAPSQPVDLTSSDFTLL